MSRIQLSYCTVPIILAVCLLLPSQTLSETWKKLDVRLNETFQGIVETFGKGKDPRFFYTILEARPNGQPFRLNKYSGALEVLPRGFDYDKGPEYRRYDITIQVTSQSDKTMNESIPVSIIVLDVNDKPPYFVNEPRILIANIPPIATVGTFVFQLNASDPDTTATIKYSIVDFVAKGRFVVDPNSGTIRIGRVGLISSFPGTRYELEVEARDIRGEVSVPQVAKTRIVVIVGQVSPQFYEPHMFVNFNEKQPPNSLVLTVRAKSFQNQPLSYSMVGSGVAMSSFSLDSATGAVRVSRLLNFDNITEPRYYNFTVMATELGPPGLTSSTSLVIKLEDINDNPPVFELANYVVSSTREDVAIDQTLFLFKATDLDSEENGRVSYELASDQDIATTLGHGDDFNSFSVLKQTGELKPATRLDFDRTPSRSYWFRVVASDQGNQTLSNGARVRVPLINVNDEYPEFLVANRETGFSTFLMEDAPVAENIVVGVVRADDPDGDGVKYGIVDFQTKPPQRSGGELPFAIDRVTGFVRQVHPLAPGVSAYVLNVSAEDDGACCPGIEPNQRHTNYTSFVVNVQDVNNNRPRLNCSACNGTAIKEGYYANFTVCQLQATDGDLGDNGIVHYSLRGKDFFTVDPLTGTVYVANANLDRERMDGRFWIYLTGIAEDTGKPRLSDYCSFQITIEDANDNRPMLDIPSEYNFYVGSLAPRTVIALLSAIDKDTGPNGQVSFFVEPSSPLVNFFVIESSPDHNSGIVKIADGIDEERLRTLAGFKRTLSLPLILRDHGVPELSTNVSITIQLSTGGGELRPFWDESFCSVVLTINETTQPGFVVANLTARVNGHDNSPIRYLIPTRDSPLVFTERIPFWFETESSGSKSVRIYLYRPVNAEMKDRYVFTVRATSSCVACRNSEDWHGIAASSQSQLSIDRLINITILDVNDEVPFFLNTDPDNNCYYGSFPENPRETGILVATAKADDLDTTAPNNVIARYELRFTDEEDAGKFVIDPKTGEIRTNSTDFDFETKQTYSIRIVAFDGALSPLNGYQGPNVGETFLRIQILDVNDNSPHFENSTAFGAVQEHAPRGTLVMQIIAIDPDQWDELSYEIMSGDPNGVFIVKGDSIYVNNPLKLDADIVCEYHLVYRAFDNRFSDYINVTITVTNVVDEPPIFAKPVYLAPSIVENDPSQRFLIEVDAKGAEILTVRYSLAGNESSFFSSANNRISLSRPLDHDVLTGGHSTYRINVEAYDNEGRQSGLFGSTVVEVPVVDINDNAPIFLQDTLVGEVKEGLAEVQTVLRVSAIDADSEANGEVSYKLAHQQKPALFELDQRTGLLRTVFGAKFERQNPPVPIFLTVIASDGGAPSLSTTEILTVNVVDINNHAPKCSIPEQKIEMFEDASDDIPIAMVAASDNDDPNSPNGMVTFALDETSSQFFALTSGENVAYIYPRPGEIDYEQLSIAQRNRDPRLDISVTISDRGQPAIAGATCHIIVAIRNANDNPPVFQPPSEHISISESASLRSVIYRNFTIKDADSSSGTFTFRINERTNLRRQFAIAQESQHSNRPVITLVERLDREITPEYRLEILAIDDMSPELTGTATLSIVLIDVNNHPPHLAPLESPAIVPEHQQPDPSIVVAILTAEDPDTPDSNGKAFGFELDCAFDSSIPNVCDLFTLDYDYVHSSAHLYVKANSKAFIRAMKPSYLLPIVVWDNAVNGGKTAASLSYRDTLTVIVGGGDYYQQRASHKDIDVLLYTDWLRRQDLVWVKVGRPFALDADDWDFAYKQFKIVRNSNTSVVGFSPESGQIVLQASKVQPGSYDLSFRISDDKLNVEVISTVTINVKILPQGFLSSLHSLRIANLSPFEIVKPADNFPRGSVRKKREVTPASTSSRLYRFRKSLASIFGVGVDSVLVLSVTDVPQIPSYRPDGPRQQATDIFFTITDETGSSTSKFSREFVVAKLLARKKEIEDGTDMEISAVPGDACAPDPLIACPDSDSCHTTIQLDESSPLLVDANATSFVGVRLNVMPSCSDCPAASAIDSFRSCSCIPGRGTCLLDSHPSGCSCNAPFDGPRCEMTSRSFQWPGGGYAILPIRPLPTSCNSGSFQIEILPNQTTTDTTILFLGSSWLLPNGSNCPYLLLEIVSGKPQLTIDLCSSSVQTPSVIRLENVGNVLAPGRSFRLEVTWIGASFTVMSPDCSTPCSVNKVVPGSARLLSGTYVVLLGGKPLPGELRLTNIAPLRQSRAVNFSGCLRNLWINNELYDLWLEGAESTSGRTTPGCPDMFGACISATTTQKPAQYITTSPADREIPAPSRQCNNPTVSQCASATNRTPYCRCKPGHAGKFCESDPLPYSFGAQSYVRWEMLPDTVSLQSFFIELQVSFRSRDEEGILLWLDSAQELTQMTMSRRRITEPDHIALLIFDGRIAAKVQLPPMKESESIIYRSMDSPRVTDGDWHVAYLTLDFVSCSLRLKLDHGEGALNNMLWSLSDSVCSSTSRGPVFLLGPAGFWYAGGRPDVVGSTELQLDNACMQDIRINGYSLPMSAAEGSTEIARFVDSNGVTGGCSPVPLSPSPPDCSSVSCPVLSQCITEWRQVSCLCPTGLVPLINDRTLTKCPSSSAGLADPCNWSPNDITADPPPCVYGVCQTSVYSNGSFCQCFDGYYGARCLPHGSVAIESPEKSRIGPDGLQIAAIIVPIVVGLCLVIILVWFICAVSSRRRAKQKAAALGINAPGNLSSVSEAELLADAVLGQSMAPVDNDAAGEEDVDLGAYDLSRLKAAIMEKQRSAMTLQQQQQHQLQQIRTSNQALMTIAPTSSITMPPPYVTVVGDLDRMLAARLAVADSVLEQPSSLSASRPGMQTSGGSPLDDLSLAGTEDGEYGAAETNLDLSFLARLGGPFTSLTKQMGVDTS